MPSNANRQFLDFEKPIKELIDEVEKLKHTAEKTKVIRVTLSKSWRTPSLKNGERLRKILQAGKKFN